MARSSGNRGGRGGHQGGGRGGGPDKATQDNRANQMNPNNERYDLARRGNTPPRK